MRLTKGDAIICTEVGQHQMWAASTTNTEAENPSYLRRTWHHGLHGLGASIGAKMACGDMGHPDTPVFNIAGDGCFRMNMNEIATATPLQHPDHSGCGEQPCARHGAPVAEPVLRKTLFTYRIK